MFIWLCDWRQIHLPLPWSQCRTATGTHFKRAGVTLTGLQACVRLFPSPQIKCCFSRLAVAQSLSVCLCVMCVYVCIWVWVVVFFMSGWKMAWGTSLPPCLIIKYEFRLFLYRELEWSLILRRAGYEFSSPRGNMRDYWARLVIFFICSEKAAFTGSLVKSTCHIDFLDDLTQDCLFVGFNSGLFIKQNIQEDTKEWRKAIKDNNQFPPQSVNWFSLICEPQGHCLIHQQRPISINPILFSI